MRWEIIPAAEVADCTFSAVPVRWKKIPECLLGLGACQEADMRRFLRFLENAPPGQLCAESIRFIISA